MLHVEVNGQTSLNITWNPGMTAGDLVQKITDEYGFRYYGNPQLQETHDGGRILSNSDEIVDDRVYYLSVWIREKISG